MDLELELAKKSDTDHTHVCQDITDLELELSKKSDIDHTHITDDITDLAQKLALKYDVGHTHAISDILELVDYLAKMSNFLTEDEINDLISNATKTPWYEKLFKGLSTIHSLAQDG